MRGRIVLYCATYLSMLVCLCLLLKLAGNWHFGRRRLMRALPQRHEMLAPWAIIAECTSQEEIGIGRRFTYKGGYFETRDMRKRGEGEWKGCPDLFGHGPSTKVFS